jgi:hypothetical protein
VVKVLRKKSYGSTINGMAKQGKTLKLSPALRAELQALVHTFYGESLSEVITFILREWVHLNRDNIRRTAGSGTSGSGQGADTSDKQAGTLTIDTAAE